MLSDALKETIQSSYSQVLVGKKFKPRKGQRLMIAEIAKTLAGLSECEERGPDEPYISVVEAGTGTGKTLAYLAALLPLALENRKKLIISTATILLQEQLMQKDLPDFLKYARLPFHYAVAKGRGRYLCLTKIYYVLQAHDTLVPGQALFEDEMELRLDEDRLQLYQKLVDAFSEGGWDGDRDTWKEVIDFADWSPVTTDHRQCTNRQCSYFRECSYFRARQELTSADVIVANHDLVLADLSLGGGALLPDPGESIFLFDEAHHLPVKALSHFTAHFRLRQTRQWLGKLPAQLADIRRQAGAQLQSDLQLKELASLFQGLENNMGFLEEMAQAILADNSAEEERFRFPKGEVPQEMRLVAKNIARLSEQLEHFLEGFAEDLTDRAMEVTGELKALLEQQYARIAVAAGRCEALRSTCHSFAQESVAQEVMPVARWIRVTESLQLADYEFRSSPLSAADILSESLWAKCYAAVLTSATLFASNHFDRIKANMGLPDQTLYCKVPSPFDYNKAASLEIPVGAVDPKHQDNLTQSILSSLDTIIDPQESTLVVFNSRKQLQAVYAGLSGEMRGQVMVQDHFSKQVFISRHREKIDKGQGSIMFGLASMMEGIDLPGDYLMHVVITRLPFAVPDDPVEATLAEWLESQGKNPFLEISVPDASLRLKQACGRLLRSESDRGRITLLDRRILSKRYGKAMLAALPDYRLVVQRS